jgi:Aldehyde:ferredoxin oxidoreductase
MGLGAVMGSKNLKAIALRGEEKVLIYDGKEVKRLNREFLKKYTKMFPMTENFSKLQIGRMMPSVGLATAQAKVWPKMPPDFFKVFRDGMELPVGRAGAFSLETHRLRIGRAVVRISL